MIDNELLKIIACPRCKGDLVLGKDKLACIKCKKDYEIKDDIPILLDK